MRSHLTEKREQHHRGREQQERGPQVGQSMAHSEDGEGFVAGVKELLGAGGRGGGKGRLVPADKVCLPW